MGNNIIVICGCPRTGKTTLTKRLLDMDSSYRVISLDSIYYSLKDSFQSLEIDNYKSIRELSGRLYPFVRNLIKEYSYDFPHFNYIIEGMEILPRDYIVNDDLISKVKIVCLGYFNINEDTLFNLIREHDKELECDTYTMHMSDEELKKRVSFYTRFSKELLSECEKYSIPYWDMEHNREGTIDEIFRYLID